LAFLEGVNRWNTIFSRMPPARVWVFSERITFYPSAGEQHPHSDLPNQEEPDSGSNGGASSSVPVHLHQREAAARSTKVEVPAAQGPMPRMMTRKRLAPRLHRAFPRMLWRA
jgi:hypothetical protein